MKLKKTLFAGIAAVVSAGTLLGSNIASAQKDWPTKSISLVVPFAAGGPTDSIARLIAVPMGQALGQTVVVENVPGAGGTIASTKVARAAPDATQCTFTTWAWLQQMHCTTNSRMTQ